MWGGRGVSKVPLRNKLGCKTFDYHESGHMPILCVFFGIIVRMWHDDQSPPHVHVEYHFDATALLQRNGFLVEGLRDESYFKRLLVDAGAVCWPNGLELSPSRLFEMCQMTEAA
jgi:hypothetical protein